MPIERLARDQLILSTVSAARPGAGPAGTAGVAEVALVLPLFGPARLLQSGRRAVLQPGDLALYETLQPHVLVGDGPAHRIRIRIDDLDLPLARIRRATAVRLVPHEPITDLAADYLRELVPHGGASVAVDTGVAAAGIELVRALIMSCAAPGYRLERQGGPAEQLIEYIRSHLGEPGLTPGRIAEAHHISVRKLYKLLSAQGISLGPWVRQQRLEGCRQELSTPACDCSITEIATRWGFGDPDSFGRAFRQAYGTSPRQWRIRSVHQ